MKKSPKFLFVFLSGGSDGMSMLVPYSDKNYQSKRPLTAINEKDVLKINDTLGVNKLLKDSYYDWFINSQAIFYPLAGQENNSRSHFQAADTLGYGIGGSAIKSDTGFLYRLKEKMPNDNFVSFSDNQNSFTKGPKVNIVNISDIMLKEDSKVNLNFYGKDLSCFKGSYCGLEKIQNILEEKNFDSMTKFEKVGNLMKILDCSVGYVEIPDWDTHGKQNGRLNSLLSNLSTELFNFKKSIGEDLWKDTVVVVMSEFGRTLQDNGTGTEHGHGNLISIFSGRLDKSYIGNEWQELKEENLHEKRELNVLTDYRDLLGGIFKELFDLKKEDIEYVFPKSKPLSIGVNKKG